MPELALIGLGSNLGDRKAHLDFAVASLSNTPGLSFVSVSTYHETRPVGGPPGQGAFLNAALAAETTLAPEALLEALNAVEAEGGRVRDEHWGARTLDLDLLLFGSRVIETPRLQVPHPRLALRRFVLAPLVEIAPDVVDPATERTTAALLANLDRRPSYLAFADTSFRMPPLRPRKTAQQGNPLFNDLLRGLAAAPVERRSSEVRSKPFFWLAPDDPESAGVLDRWLKRFQSEVEQTARILDAAYWSTPEWADRWLISLFWFDSLFLTARASNRSPEIGNALQRFVEARGRVLPPTFVVTRSRDFKRLGLGIPGSDWCTPVGRDTPILRVDDFHSEASLDAILSACAATRAG